MNRKREAVPEHSLPPQEQILTYWGRFTKCPYETVQKSAGVFSSFSGKFDIFFCDFPLQMHKVLLKIIKFAFKSAKFYCMNWKLVV